ncbi:MAG: hypothetical protein WBG71_10820 [Leeuwenhoekiella sp.]
MKMLNFLFFLILAQLCQAQNDITIDFNQPVFIKQKLVERGEYTLKIIPKATFSYRIQMKRETNLLGNFSIPASGSSPGFAKAAGLAVFQQQLNFKDNTKYTLEVEVFDGSMKSIGKHDIVILS